MNTPRRLALGLVNTIFRLFLFFAISLLAFLFLYTNSSYVQSVLSDKDAYDRFVPSILESNQNQPISAGGSVTLGDSEIQKIVQEAFPASTVQISFETILENVYAWLEGDTPLQFRIDLTENEQALAQGLADYAITRVEMLPECTTVQTANIDPFSATCKPPFTNLASERDSIVREFQNNSLFLSDAIITEDILTNTVNDIHEIPTYYQLASSLWIFVLCFLCALGMLVVYLSSTKKVGFRKLGYALLTTSISLVVFTFVFSYVLPVFSGSLPIFQTSTEGIDALLNDITIQLGRDLARVTIVLCVPLAVTGLLFIIATRKTTSAKYKNSKQKSGLVSSDGVITKNSTKKTSRPPIQSSETSDSKPVRSKKNTKYKKINKKGF